MGGAKKRAKRPRPSKLSSSPAKKPNAVADDGMGGAKKRAKRPRPSKLSSSPAKKPNAVADDGVRFTGAPIPAEEAKSRWPHRYQSKRETTMVSVTLSDGSTEEKEFFQAHCHYTKAIVDGVVFDLNEDAYFQASEGEPHFIGKIVEMFETVNKEAYVCAQWFFRAKDTVIKDSDYLIDKRRVFYSDVKDDNPLTCIISKVKIAELGANMSAAKKENSINSCDLYVDMTYSFPHAFTSLYTDKDNETPSVVDGMSQRKPTDDANNVKDLQQSTTTTVLDLYSGCGAMSSGLSIGALLAGVNVVTGWAVDFNSHACQSLKFNHPNTEVRNEDIEDFFVLLTEWDNLCKKFNFAESNEIAFEPNEKESDDSEINDGVAVPSSEFEVEKLVAICYGDPVKTNKRGLHFKVRWKGYGSADDTWEPIDGLSKCTEKIKEFVQKGHKARLLPLPGDVDLICGGPPCQGISSLNRFRQHVDPLEDKRNRQLLVFMNIVEFLKPRYVLMENVTDILKFAKGQLANYAVGCLVSMNYQARLGIMGAGAYGVPQCRMRFFLWGAGPTESLPQFPLPTHKVMKKGAVIISEYKEIIVGHLNEHNELHNAVLLGDAVSDLPKVTNNADQDEMPYGSSPHTAFQKFIRLTRHDMFGYADGRRNDHKCVLYDHLPFQLNSDDYERACLIPKLKGANFRNLPGLIIGSDNVVKLGPSAKRLYCKSGKPLVPRYAITFEKGKSIKPFGRLSVDDSVATVVTRPDPRNQVVLHWGQDRVLTIREIARLQGFPDCYKLFGPIKERYKQIGNAVSFSVSVPLGYCLAKALNGSNSATPLSLPFKFPDCFGELKAARSGQIL